MKLFFLLGFRNIFRNKRRTFLTCSVISVALCSLMLLDGLMLSMKSVMIRLQTSTYMGHGQIHTPTYQEDDDISNTLKNLSKFDSVLSSDKLVEAYSPRVLASGMLSSSYEGQIVRVVGVDFQKEANVSKLKSSLFAGEYPSSENKEKALILGSTLAKKLRAEIGDKLILTFSSKGSSEVSQEMFRLSGIVKFNMRPFDDLFVFVDLAKSQELYGLTAEETHEIAVKFTSIDIPSVKDAILRQKMKEMGALYEPWGELSKALQSMLDMTQYSVGFIYSLVFIFILFAILNTMFMSIFERSFEFGVLKALGTKSWQVAYLILSECFSLGVFGAFFGCLLGLSLIFYLNVHGISFSGSEFNGISMTEPIKPVFRYYQISGVPLSVVIITLLSGLYPAFHTARMSIANAMKKSL